MISAVIRLQHEQHIVKQPVSTSGFRFRLTTLLILMIPMACISYVVGTFIIDRPIIWIEYSADKMANRTDLQQAALVFYTADWDPTAKLVEGTSVDTYWIRRMLRMERIIAMRADCTEWQNNAHDDIPDSINFGATPIVAVYSPGNRDQPIAVLGDSFTEEELYNALAMACR